MAYETIRRLGRGGMGVVDLAVDEDGHEVALKRLSLNGTPSELATARQRIRREAESLQQLDHPAVVHLLDVLDDGDDIVLVMDHLPGGNLATRVAESGPLTADEVGAIADRLLGALAAAHRLGIVHRDIKPSNVLFDEAGDAVLADFGAATHRDATAGLTATHLVVGTPGFMAPEQARGEATSPASDVFSLAATLVYAATGDGPFGTADPQLLLLRAAAGKTARLPRTLPAEMRRALEAMLDPDPSRRPTAAAAGHGPAGTRMLEPVRVVPRKRRRLAIAGVLAVLALGAGAAVFTGADGSAGPLAASGHGGDASPTTSTTAPCVDLPFQPCGQDRAPNTDGRACLPDFADYDGDATNGCEAEPDTNPDRMELDGAAAGNLVPADDLDEFLLPVVDQPQLFGDGQIHVTLTAPTGVSQRLTVLSNDSTRELGTAMSSDGAPATVSIKDPNFGRDDSTTLLIRVESFGSDRTAEPYEVTHRGSY